MKLTTTLPIHRWLWLLLSVIVFVLLGFVDFVPAWNKGGGMQYWGSWFIAWEFGAQQLPDCICYLSGFTILLLIPAVILGFVFQCIVVSAWKYSADRANDQAASQQEKGTGIQ